ncbi:tyrosine-type recombinase/integrase [Anaerobacillus isosaccharinicus]|nr:tyrosine-type recombinase/integrase [Anaerobacillus isosaccharinicus]QOY37719.1 tyrosine-type recombinase/integrase [Anaerobacillus isosaccharinicus]
MNESLSEYSYAHFTDLDLVYSYIHLETHDDEHKNKNANTKHEYIKDLLQFMTFASFILTTEEAKGNSVLRLLEKRHIRQYQDWLKNGSFSYGKKGYAVATRAKKITIVKGFLNWLFTIEFIEYPLHAIFKKVTINSDELPDRSLSYNEVMELLTFYKDHPINHAILLMLATTGLRVAEIAKAKWSDLYLDTSINGGSYFLKVKAKGNKDRHAFILPILLESLQIMRKRRGLNDQLNSEDDTYIFVTNKNKPYDYNYLSNYVVKIIQNTKFKWLVEKQGNVSPHWFRHHFVHHLVVDLGADLTVVQKTVGHESRVTTEKYVDKYLSNKQNAGLLLQDINYRVS